MLHCFKYFLIYILRQNFSKVRLEKFWTISSLYVLNCFKRFLIYILRQNVSKVRQAKFWTISSLCALNCFKYFQIDILGQMSKNNQTRKKIWTISNLHVWFFMIKWLDIHKDFWTISSLCVSKWLDIHKDFWTISYLCVAKMLQYYWCALKALLSKNWFYFFFLIFWHAKFQSFRMPCYWH